MLVEAKTALSNSAHSLQLFNHVDRAPLRCRRRTLLDLRRTRGTALVAIRRSFSHLFQVLRLQYEKEQRQAHVTVQTKFNYAWGLVKSPVRDHQVEGVSLLQGVYPVVHFFYHPTFILSQNSSGQSPPDAESVSITLRLDTTKCPILKRQNVSTVRLAVGPPLKSHSSPLALLLEKEPTNLQAQSLAQLIEKGVTRGVCCLFRFGLPP